MRTQLARWRHTNPLRLSGGLVLLVLAQQVIHCFAKQNRLRNPRFLRKLVKKLRLVVVEVEGLLVSVRCMHGCRLVVCVAHAILSHTSVYVLETRDGKR